MSPEFIPEPIIESPETLTQKVEEGLFIMYSCMFYSDDKKSAAGEGNPADIPESK